MGINRLKEKYMDEEFIIEEFKEKFNSEILSVEIKNPGE